MHAAVRAQRRLSTEGKSISSLSLFGPGPQILLDDASGRIEYRPDFLSAGIADRWFEILQRQIPWRSERRLMYERELDVPRLLGSFSLDDPALPGVLAEAAALVRAALAVDFTSVGLNLYRDEHDSVAPHNDRLNEIAEGRPIALLSLGATRRMTVRAKQPPRRVLHVDLEAGSLLVMDYRTQLHYDHGIPKEKLKAGPRISLAFRVRPPGARHSGEAEAPAPRVQARQRPAARPRTARDA